MYYTKNRLLWKVLQKKSTTDAYQSMNIIKAYRSLVTPLIDFICGMSKLLIPP